MWPELTSFFTQIAQIERPVIEFVNQERIDGTSGFHQFSMQMQNLAASGTFVQIVNILSHHIHIKPLFQFGNSVVSGVGFHFKKLFAALVVETKYQCRIAFPCFGRGYLGNVILFPQSSYNFV